jgi:hypothetical protein
MDFDRGDDAFAGVKVLSEVDERLMMMFGAGASSCAAKCGGAAFSRLTEVTTTTVPAGTSPAPPGGPEILLSLKDQAVALAWLHSNAVPSTQIQ